MFLPVFVHFWDPPTTLAPQEQSNAHNRPISTSILHRKVCWWSLDNYTHIKGKASSCFTDKVCSVYCRLALLPLCILSILQALSASTGSVRCQWNAVKSHWVTWAKQRAHKRTHESPLDSQYVLWHRSFHAAFQSVQNKFIHSCWPENKQLFWIC